MLKNSKSENPTTGALRKGREENASREGGVFLNKRQRGGLLTLRTKK